MTDSQAIPWKRVSVEAIAIVGSILLAFGIQAWWDERLERIDEAEQLIRLHAEFTENIERIVVRADGYAKIVEINKYAFELIEAARDRGEDSVDLPVRTLNGMFNAPTFEADTPILDGLIRSGRLEIIEDQSLLRPIASWERRLSDYTAFAERARRTVDNHLVPALAVRGRVGWVMMINRERFFDDSGSDPTGAVTVSIDNELETLVAERFRHARSANDQFGLLKKVAEDVLMTIETSQSN